MLLTILTKIYGGKIMAKISSHKMTVKNNAEVDGDGLRYGIHRGLMFGPIQKLYFVLSEAHDRKQ
jgi:hypothetical protein